ncbi:hypothetical protein, partial [Telluria aromaticivorans]|uniref:hypothetical protein n=1 Tax=Telluria aromaticivorans TaxID=2725995 RepID=UPI001BB17990
PVSLTLDPKLFGVDSMNYIAKADISTLPKPDISTLPLQGGQVPCPRVQPAGEQPRGLHYRDLNAWAESAHATVRRQLTVYDYRAVRFTVRRRLAV